MADLPSRKTLFAVGRRSIVTTPNTRINPNVIDVAGSDVGILLGATSLMGEEVVAALAIILQGLFVETARADQLDRIAFDRYGLTRFPATPATVTLTFTRGAGSSGTIPAGNRVQTPDGTVFAIDSDVVCPAGSFSVTGTATAILAGPDSNVPAGTLTQFLDAPFDPSIVVTNATPAAGGTDAETDAQFRGRIMGFFPTVRRGTLGAIEFGALQVPGVAVAKAFEILSGSGLPACAVQLIIADANGNASQTLISQVEVELLDFRAAGIPVSVESGSVFQVAPVTWSISIATGVDSNAAKSQLRAVTVAVAQFLRPGETLYRSSLIAAARTIPGIIVTDSSLVDPAFDIVPNKTQLIRIDPTAVVFTTPPA